MRVAVPLFGQEVAPRFGYADNFLIAELKDGKVVCVDDIRLEFSDWHLRLEQLHKRGVDTILCGGFNRFYLPFAKILKIDVIAGLSGDADQLVEAFARGEEMPTFPCCRKETRRSVRRGCERDGPRRRARKGEFCSRKNQISPVEGKE